MYVSTWVEAGDVVTSLMISSRNWCVRPYLLSESSWLLLCLVAVVVLGGLISLLIICLLQISYDCCRHCCISFMCVAVIISDWFCLCWRVCGLCQKCFLLTRLTVYRWLLNISNDTASPCCTSSSPGNQVDGLPAAVKLFSCRHPYVF